ncbi:MAG: LuxR family transcriptional regulator [Chlamydiales bacterium]|nr:LuxR family transcriptional regulator [Chlamydiales bacterium]
MSKQNFTDFFKYNDRHQDYLGKVVDPLKRSFGLDVFWKSSIKEDGQFSTICSYTEAFGHFWENQCYRDMAFYVTPRRLKSGYFLLDHDVDYTKYMDSARVKHPLYHPFLIIRKEGKNKANLFGFASTQVTPALPSLYMNNLPLLNSFLDYISEDSKTKEGLIDLVELIGSDSFYNRQYGENSVPKPEQSSPFLRQLGLSKELLNAALKLSIREKEVLLACVDGKTAAQNGEELDLSARTVQFYLENTKNKLGVLSRDELLHCGKLLKIGGFLES